MPLIRDSIRMGGLYMVAREGIRATTAAQQQQPPQPRYYDPEPYYPPPCPHSRDPRYEESYQPPPPQQQEVHRQRSQQRLAEEAPPQYQPPPVDWRDQMGYVHKSYCNGTCEGRCNPHQQQQLLQPQQQVRSRSTPPGDRKS